MVNIAHICRGYDQRPNHRYIKTTRNWANAVWSARRKLNNSKLKAHTGVVVGAAKRPTFIEISTQVKASIFIVRYSYILVCVLQSARGRSLVKQLSVEACGGNAASHHIK